MRQIGLPYHQGVSFPLLGAGETLYSWCSRFHEKSFSVSALTTSRTLFSNPYAGLKHDFPSHLDSFVFRTDGDFGTSKHIAQRHTLLGYFLPFLHRDRADVLLHEVSRGSASDLKMRLGIPASGVRGYHPLKCCKLCIESDMYAFGRPTWKLVHQPPSTLVCIHHYRPLVITWQDKLPVHLRKWLIPNARLGPGHAEIRLGDDQAQEQLQQAAALAAHVLELTYASWSPEITARAYRAWAMDVEVITTGGRLRHAKMIKELAPRLEPMLRAFRDVPFAPVTLQSESIVNEVVAPRSSAAHPLKQIVLLVAMHFSAANAIEAVQRSASKDADEGNCVSDKQAPHNGLSPRRLDDLELEYTELLRRGSSVRAASFKLGVSVNTGVRWARRSNVSFPTRAKLLRPQLLECIRTDLREGLDRDLTASKHSVSLTTIHRLLSADHDLRDAWALARHERARQNNRAAWQQLLEEHPGVSHKQLRKIPGNGWAWLYRHDRAWLEGALPSLWTRGL